MSLIEVDNIDFGEWVEFSVRKTCDIDQVVVSFSPKGEIHSAAIRVGLDVMRKMRWKNGDKVSLLLSKNDKYKWALVATSRGYKLTQKPNVTSCAEIAISWPHSGVTYTKSKECRYEIDKEKLIIHVPM